MTDTIFGSGSDQWVCPNDRQLALRAKLQTGWSVHTYQTEKQRRNQHLSPEEVEAILQVIQRAERLDVLEQQRIGRLVERLETMRRNVMGNGLSQCLLCGEVLGFLGSASVFCKDCRKKVCTKCGIEASPGQKRPLWLCKICSEQREVENPLASLILGTLLRSPTSQRTLLVPAPWKTHLRPSRWWELVMLAKPEPSILVAPASRAGSLCSPRAAICFSTLFLSWFCCYLQFGFLLQTALPEGPLRRPVSERPQYRGSKGFHAVCRLNVRRVCVQC
ncbi:rab effector Noc2 [Piliocolobus tephrosceles]|uniref:rab effector Noc2 n=1 Tax=Piliocolobus tephrosceles TaxID=591936 RepID=UPI000E6B1FDD|nr:rab effector Noc2 [Piliocolobus tephrosceles]